ncbi:Heat shock 70 kDa protein 15 [Frankliniella fusca]|uniref:Heat shock 70 kDa protein 15 n=1 Tax=Frankliniella fusca TaxID=407009 RepID=A0AAE1LFD7_9NEOP|nr:Heat shock 70 kDa protein 15 [Frankliniella fusca]
MSASMSSASTVSSALLQLNGTAATTTMSPEQREQLRVEFFRTYDMMTGVRIAATLGGFFGMMVLLVLYKSRCRPRKTAIKEVRLAAAKAVVEEEDQQEAVAAAIYMQTVVTGRVPRRSLGALSAPVGPVAAWLAPRGAGEVPGAAPGAAGAGPGAGAGLSPRGSVAYSLGACYGRSRPASFEEDAAGDPLPLPVRFSSLSGCSLLDAKVAISSVRR